LTIAGRYREAELAFRHAEDVANRENQPENADSLLVDQALVEFTSGQSSAAHATLSRIRRLDPDDPEVPILESELGNSRPAEAYLSTHSAEAHPGTLVDLIYLPRVRAALAMRRGKPLEALEALDSTRPYELFDYNIPSDRAAACLQAGRPDCAVTEFRKILSNPGIEPVSILYPLARLGLARALALEGNKMASREAYEQFLASWKNADPDLPVLQQAQREYAKFQK
jgi:eukaryotic-like serine/threonine-protein kinase